MGTSDPDGRPSSETFHEEGDDAPRRAAAVPVGSDRFVLGREIGRGAMGRVVEATDRQFDRTVAVKLLLGTGEAAVARFATEAGVTGRLEHPSIPSVYERGQLANGTAWVAMHLARGRPMDVALAEGATLADRLRLLPVLLQVAHALGYAHEHGIVHRDLKPQNIIVGTHGRAFLLDWGIAKVRGASVDGPSESGSGTGPHTLHGSVLGTPAYMAPEQARGDVDEVGARTDVFALGAILYHLLAGFGPYRGPTLHDTLGAAQEVRFEPLSVVAPHAPRALVAICDRAMARSSNDRFADGRAFAVALESFLSSAVLARTADRIDRFAQWVAAAGLGIVLLSSGVAWTFVSGLRQQGPSSLLYLTLAVLGASLSIVEWRTAGRYSLDALILALASCTGLVGIAAALIGVSLTLELALDLPWGDGSEVGPVVIAGVWEALGNIPGSLVLVAVQLVLWGAVHRSVRRRSVVA